MKRLFLFSIATLFSVSTYAQIKGVDNVVLIGADGFGAFMLTEHADKLPNLSALMARGSSTLEMRSVLPSSSAVNWASILMGAGPELHGYTEWGSKTPEVVSRVLTEKGTFPDIVYLTRQKYPTAEIGVFYGWEGIGYLFDTIGVSTNVLVKDDVELSQRAVKYLADKKPKLSFFYITEPDHTGHTTGWNSPDYVAMCQKVDAHVGEIVEGIKKAGMEKNTIIIFVSDHGGINTGHGGKTMVEMQVPYIVVGPNVKQGYKIEESMMVYDNSGTIAYILGLDQPQVWLARPAKSIFNARQ